MSSKANPTFDTWQVYRRLLRYVGKQWHALLAAFIGYGVYSLVQAAIPEMMKFLTGVLENPEPKKILMISVMPVSVAIIQSLAAFVGSYAIAWLGQNVVFQIRNEAFQHLLDFPQRVFSQSATGRITSKLVFDAQQITAAGSDAIVVLLREGLTVIILMGYLLYTNWKLTLIMITVGPIIGAIVRYSGQRFRRISNTMQANMGSITSFISEAIDGQQQVKIFGGQEQEKKRFFGVSRSFEKQNVKLVATKEAGTGLVHIVISAGVGVIIYLYFWVMGEQVDVGEFLAFITGVALIQKPVRALTEVNVKIQRGLTGAASLFELLDTPPEKDQGQIRLQRARGDIRLEQVCFSYEPEQPVLKGLNMDIRAGQTVALVGRSGAGKSTIAALLPRFYDVDSGSILLDGRPLTEYVLADLRHQIALVSQKVMLFNDSVRNNIAYGELQGASEAEIIAALKNAHAWEFVQKLEGGLDAQIGQDGTQLSGGQRQRLAIARALLKDAPVLILDEATSALDNESEFKIQQALEQLMKGRTTIVIAHRLSTIEKADRIFVMDQGQVVEQGDHATLLAQDGYYTQLYRMNFQD